MRETSTNKLFENSIGSARRKLSIKLRWLHRAEIQLVKIERSISDKEAELMALCREHGRSLDIAVHVLNIASSAYKEWQQIQWQLLERSLQSAKDNASSRLREIVAVGAELAKLRVALKKQEKKRTDLREAYNHLLLNCQEMFHAIGMSDKEMAAYLGDLVSIHDPADFSAALASRQKRVS